ncbi:MAG TPA: tRNA uridine-5-carboxymethylaminomethyl(34) synthesis GTPase MnmE [Steroidobacteraceae bacterium]|nr:tRNA uridine-5-carboxymethylaminomethyl(34) synthesis GTPase MnmE [Steroidobacteraceae bacterium]
MSNAIRLGPEDTIAALSTARGRSAIAVLRVTGPDVQNVGSALLRPWPLQERVATLCEVRANNGELIDRGLATFFRAPASFTGEDVLEISTHGGLLVPALVEAALLGLGVRQALPGEFTRRAVLNGRLDILQAEAIGDLIDAASVATHHAAIAQLDGALSREVVAIRHRLIELEALISYDIDFPEEDDGPISRDRVGAAARDVAEAVEHLLCTAPMGELLREGALAVIAGRPNAGKSSLFNALLGRDRAIVTEFPGTTRDALEAVIDVRGWPIRLVDTAGIRTTMDQIEKLGVEVSERYIRGSHLILLCDDSDSTVSDLHAHLLSLSSAPVLHVRTKGDLVAKEYQPLPGHVLVSATAREGLDALLDRIAATLEDRYGEPIVDFPVITRARHRQSLASALEEIVEFRRQWMAETLPSPIAAVHLQECRRLLEELIGTVDIDDVLDKLFSSFCVGK